MAKHFNGGGVGHYNSFTHVDTGKLREWGEALKLINHQHLARGDNRLLSHF